MVTHNFPKWFPWPSKSCDMLTISLLVKIGLKSMKLQSEVVSISNNVNKPLILPVWTTITECIMQHSTTP